MAFGLLTVRREIVGVLGSGAARHELLRGSCISGDGIRAKEGMHVRCVFPRKNDGVDVFLHEALGHNDGVGVSDTSAGQ